MGIDLLLLLLYIYIMVLTQQHITDTNNQEDKMSLTINKISDSKKLYRKYDGQSDSQGIYIELDCKNETLSVSYNAEIGNAVPFSVYHGHEQRWGIPLLTTDAINSLLDEIEPLAERVVAGYESEWDGNNHVAEFDEDAQNALDEIEELCNAAEENADETDTVQEWDIENYLDSVTFYHDSDEKQCKWQSVVTVIVGDYGTITGKTTDDELSDIKTAIDDDTDGENIVLNGVEKWLTKLRDQCKSNSEE